MMREKEKKEKEAAEMKQKRKEEREQKRAEKEQREKKRMERERKRKQSEGNQTRGKGKCARQNEEEAFEDEIYCQSSTLTHSTQAPERFRDDTPTGSDTVCILCNAREPPIAADIVFWVDCNHCGDWAHTHCALGSNTTSHHFICESCCQKNI